jgi:hypothetical protein
MYRWEYLISDDFYVRKIIASHYLSKNEVVVDVGCYRQPLPIYDRELHTIDPLNTIDGAFHGTFKEWYMHHSNIQKTIGAALLGFDFESNEEEYQCLIRFLQKVKTVVVEYAEEFEPASHQVARLLKDIPLDITTRISLQLPMVEVDGFPVYNKRQMIILERK